MSQWDQGGNQPDPYANQGPYGGQSGSQGPNPFSREGSKPDDELGADPGRTGSSGDASSGADQDQQWSAGSSSDPYPASGGSASSSNQASAADPWPSYSASEPEPTRPYETPSYDSQSYPQQSYPQQQPYPEAPSAPASGSSYADPYGTGASYGAAPDPYAAPVSPYQSTPYQSTPYQGYGFSPYGAPPPQHPQAVTAMVLGIVGLVVCPPVGIGGLVLGRRVRSEIDANPSGYSGRGMGTAGFILGILSTVYLALIVVYIIVVVGIGASGGFN